MIKLVRKLKIKQKHIVIFVLAIVAFTNSFLIAKYMSSHTGVSSSSVAKWNVSYNTSSNASDTLNLVSGNGSGEYVINITSLSEVAVNYSIELSNVPSELEVKIDDNPYRTAGADNKILFSDVGSFSDNSINATSRHTISFNAPLNSNIASTTNIGINIKFTQVN